LRPATTVIDSRTQPTTRRQNPRKEQNLSHNQLIRVGQYSVQINSQQLQQFGKLRDYCDLYQRRGLPDMI
jgi:hypothetical protein